MEKDFCKHCICLVEGDNKEWICDSIHKPIEDIEDCPERDTVKRMNNK